VAWRETASATLTESTSGTEIPEATQILFALFPRQCAGAGAPATMGGRLSSLPATFSPHLSSLPAMLRLWMTMRVLPKWIRSAEAGAARLIPYIRVKEACVCYRHGSDPPRLELCDSIYPCKAGPEIDSDSTAGLYSRRLERMTELLHLSEKK
jgi:hypothetical protein